MQAPDTNPDVRPTPLRLNGGVWSTIGAFLGVLPLILNMLPPEKYAWVPAVTALVAWLLKYVFGPPAYSPVKVGVEPTVESVDNQIKALLAQRDEILSRKEYK